MKCTDYGIYVTEQPPPTIPEERVTFTEVPGRSGSLTTLEGDYVYEDMVLTATCVISDPDRIPEIAGWLRGSGTVTFANRDGGFYYARIINQIPFEKILRGNPHRTFAVNFRCKPFWYEADVAPKNIQPASGSTSGYVTMAYTGSIRDDGINNVLPVFEAHCWDAAEGSFTFVQARFLLDDYVLDDGSIQKKVEVIRWKLPGERITEA